MPSWEHQKREFENHKDDRARALFWSMRTGKSKAVIDKACYQYDTGGILGCIIIAPNGVHINWEVNEIPKWRWDWSCEHMAVSWETPKLSDFALQDKLERLLTFKGMKWLCVNMEALARQECRDYLRRFIAACNRRYMVGVSEAHHFGHAGAKRTTHLRNLTKRASFITVETGTPILNSPLRAYSLFKCIDEEGLIPTSDPKLNAKMEMRRAAGLPLMTYEDFVQHFCIIGSTEHELKHRHKSVRRKAHKKILQYKNMEELKELMAPFSSVVLRSEIKDMPPLIRTQRIVVMSEVQRRAYIEMASKYLLEIGDSLITAEDGGPRMIKLQQVLMGYIMDTEQNKIITIDEEAPVYKAILDEVMGTLPGKSIVWFRYREDIRRMIPVLKKAGLSPLEFHGGIPTSQREKVRKDFQQNHKRIVLVGQPAAGGEGRDFSAADAVIFGSSTPNAIHVAQGEERGTAIGGSAVGVVRVRFPGTVDDRNWDIVDGKFSLADSVSGHGLRDLLMRTDV